ncbi:right-handed parallel beta-helix repeat-containing protein [Candidatus Altiarchaeota archaeon]
MRWHIVITLFLLSNIVCSETEVSDCAVLNTTGEAFVLTSDIINSDATRCFEIASDHTILDCQGHTVDGVDDFGDFGIISTLHTNLTIRNCVVSDWSDGIYLPHCSNSTLENNTANSNLESGIMIFNADGNTLINNTVAYTDQNQTVYQQINQSKTLEVTPGMLLEFNPGWNLISLSLTP